MNFKINDVQGKIDNNDAIFEISQNINGELVIKAATTNIQDFFYKEYSEIEIIQDHLMINKTKCVVQNVRTVLDDKFEAEINLGASELEVIIDKLETETVNVVFYISNLIFNYNPKYSIVNIDKYELEFQKCDGMKYITEKSSNGKESFITSKIIVNNVDINEFESLLQIISDVCWLLTLACGNLVTISKVEKIENGKIKMVKIYDSKNKFISNNVLIRIEYDPELLKKFVESTFKLFVKYKNSLLLNNLIHILLITKLTPFIEVKLLLLSNFLEVLRYNYAMNIGITSGKFKLDNNDFKWLSGLRINDRAYFEEILKAFFSDFNITGWNSDYKDIRNSIVHTGMIAGDIHVKIQKYLNFHEFCDKIILAILDWDKHQGKYIPINCPNIIKPTEMKVNNKEFVR